MYNDVGILNHIKFERKRPKSKILSIKWFNYKKKKALKNITWTAAVLLAKIDFPMKEFIIYQNVCEKPEEN